MGKGTIISGGTDGQYQVSVIYNTDRASAEKAANLAKIANLEAQIAAETDEQELNILKLQKLSLEKRNETLDAIPESKDVTAWCADLTEDLTGDVGLIEVPGESQYFNIQPGHDGNAAYDATRDGQLTPTMAMTPAAAFYNLAMLPGWQKWKPTYRYGTITAISGDTADVILEAATSTQQSLGVNQESTLTDVPVEYMTCNGAAFEAGDEVLVKFTGQDWDRPVVVGFKDEPKNCPAGVVMAIIDDAVDTYLNSSTLFALPVWYEDVANFNEKYSTLADESTDRFVICHVPVYNYWLTPYLYLVPDDVVLPLGVEYFRLNRFPSLQQLKDCYQSGDPATNVVIYIDNSNAISGATTNVYQGTLSVVSDFRNWLLENGTTSSIIISESERYLKWFADEVI